MRFGKREIDVTHAALAAIDLGRTSESVWEEYLERTKRDNPSPHPPPTDDGTDRVMTVTLGVSTIIGGRDEGFMQHTGTLLDVEVREINPDEA